MLPTVLFFVSHIGNKLSRSWWKHFP